MNLYDFVCETRSYLVEKKGYERGCYLVGVYVGTILETYMKATTEATAERIIALHDARCDGI